MTQIPESLSVELDKVLKDARNEKSGEPLGDASQKSYLQAFQKFCELIVQNHPERKLEHLSDFRIEDLKGYKTALEHGPAQLKPRTIIGRLMAIKGIFKAASAQGVIAANMTKELKVYWPEGEEEYRRLHPDEVERLCRIDEKLLMKMSLEDRFVYLRNKTMAATQKDLALRAADVVYASVQDILWNRRSAGGHVPIVIWEGKGRPRGHKDTVYLSPWGAAFLKRYLETRREYTSAAGFTPETVCTRKSGKPVGEALFFLHRDGRSLREAYYESDIFPALISAARLPDEYTSHFLRHTRITEWIEAGEDIKRVQQLARHKTIAMTLKYYHFNEKELLDDLDRRFGNGPVTPKEDRKLPPEKSVRIEIMRHALKITGQNADDAKLDCYDALLQTAWRTGNSQELFYSVHETTAKLRIGRTQLYEGWIKGGHLHPFKVGRATMFLRSEVNELASYWTSEEASKILGFKERTPVSVCKLAASGVIPALKLGKGYAFKDKDLVNYLLEKHTGRLHLRMRFMERMPEIKMQTPPIMPPNPPAAGSWPQAMQ